MDSDDEYDPDYSEGESSADDLPQTMQRDRAHWIEENREDLEFMYRHFKEVGESIMQGFFQCGNITDFARFVYRYTTPLSEPE